MTKPKTIKNCKHKHKHIARGCYHYGDDGNDCYMYIIRCPDCGAEMAGWSTEEAERGELK